MWKKNIALGGKDEKRAKYFMQVLQLEHLAKKKGNRLSGGETARMALARVLMKRFDLVVLDEPTAAMDVETTFLAEKLMMDYRRENGCAMILVTHSLSQAKRVADQVMFFHEGKLVEAGEKKQVLEAPVKEETKRFYL